jgi:uncharacterized membrane protein YfcA
MIADNTTVFYTAFGLAAFLIGLSKGGLGGMLGALITPMLALVIPIDQTIGLMLPILILADVFAVSAHWGRWNRRLVLLLLPGAVLGVTIGTYVLTNVSVLALRRGLGIIVLIFLLYRLFEQHLLDWLHFETRDWHGLIAGTVAGFTSSLAHSGGPPVAIYLLMQDLAPRVFVASSALFFTTLNWIKVPYYIYADLFDFDRLLGMIWLAPLLPLGVWIGRRYVERVNKRIFERILLVLLTISAVLLLTR